MMKNGKKSWKKFLVEFLVACCFLLLFAWVFQIALSAFYPVNFTQALALLVSIPIAKTLWK